MVLDHFSGPISHYLYQCFGFFSAAEGFFFLSGFVGMLTDSRSFISYPRHEYFRRILCSVIGEDIDKGKLPKSEMEFIKQMVRDISYNNAKNYFNF